MGMHAGDLLNIEVPAGGHLTFDALAPDVTIKAGPNASTRAEHTMPTARLTRIACKTRASASSRRPPPRARAIAEEMPPPIAPADSICIIM